MLVLVLSVTLMAAIVALAAAMVLAQRQYEGGDGGDPVGSARHAAPGRQSGPPPLPPSKYASSGLAAEIASAIESATWMSPRNSAERSAVEALRHALARAVDGDFRDTVRSAIDQVAGVTALHDVTDHDADPELVIDHLVVGPRGVFVVSSLVCTKRLMLSEDRVEVEIDADGDRAVHPMIDDLRRRMAVVADTAGSVPVQGVIVLSDVLALPDAVRSGWSMSDDVELITVGRLATTLAERGPVADRDVVVAQLRERFEPTLRSQDSLRLSGQT